MAQMNLTPFEDVLDEFYGEKGTPARDEHERKVDEALQAYHIGEAIKQTRLRQHLTQEELGERGGVQKGQISRIERGQSVSIPIMSRIFKALGISSATLDLGKAGKVALW